MKKAILFSVLILLIPLIGLAQNWNAVIVGINDYPGIYNDLSYCVNDANGMKNNLVNYKQWDTDNIDKRTGIYAGETAIKTAISNMPTSAGNTNLFSFAGHGDSEEIGGSDGLITYNLITWTQRLTPAELESEISANFDMVTTFLDACV